MAKKSQMKHSFSEVPRARIQRSTFQRNFNCKNSFDADSLVPILVDDVIPGDTFNVQCNFVCRLTSPTIVPLMDALYLETFFFFVPYRILWSNWEKFCGAQDAPGASIDFTIPIISGSVDLDPGDLGDYMGLPPGFTATELGVSALPFRAYLKIFNDWFRDQNVDTKYGEQTGDGPDNDGATRFTLVPLDRRKRHDYFTSCLPFPQRGTAVSLPLSGTAPITGIGVRDVTDPFTAVSYVMRETDGSTPTYTWVADDWGTVQEAQMLGTAEDGIPKIFADLSQATATTINDIRLAFQTQKLLERDARSGTRYVETLLAHWGVTVPDFRLQRPEFLGGGMSTMQMSATAQTSYQGTQTIEDGKGAMSGHGQFSGSHGFTKSFVEHGVIIGLASVRSDISYSQGVDRYWHKSTRFDFYYPVLAQIGEQAVLNQEIFWSNDANDVLVFGYQERYAEYRYKNSQMAGLMRVDAAGTLEVFHLSEDFGSLPTLGAVFMEAATRAPLDRALSVPTQPGFIGDFFFEMKCARPMPLYGVPGNLDRF